MIVEVQSYNHVFAEKKIIIRSGTCNPRRLPGRHSSPHPSARRRRRGRTTRSAFSPPSSIGEGLFYTHLKTTRGIFFKCGLKAFSNTLKLLREDEVALDVHGPDPTL